MVACDGLTLSWGRNPLWRTHRARAEFVHSTIHFSRIVRDFCFWNCYSFVSRAVASSSLPPCSFLISIDILCCSSSRASSFQALPATGEFAPSIHPHLAIWSALLPDSIDEQDFSAAGCKHSLTLTTKPMTDSPRAGMWVFALMPRKSNMWMSPFLLASWIWWLLDKLWRLSYEMNGAGSQAKREGGPSPSRQM